MYAPGLMMMCTGTVASESESSMVIGIITMDLRVLPRLLVVTYTQRLADLESSARGRVAAGLTGSHGTVTGGPGCLVPSA